MMDTVRERWQHLSQRERLIVSIGGVIIGLSLLFVLIVDPLLAKYDRLDRQEVRKQKELRELTDLTRNYETKRERLTKAEQRLPDAASRFSLLTFMEEAAGSARIRDHIAGMQPQVQTLPEGYEETAVDLRLEGVQLPELLALLVAIDRAPYTLHVRHLKIRPKFDNPVNLDATVRVLSYAKG
ncbi:MAG: type II secretion system protein M [Nitrospira sp.]|nr:type II secretion system protein M [Nitrospira sp.]